MNLNTEFTGNIENEIIDFIIKSPSILEKLRKILQTDGQVRSIKKRPLSMVPHELIETQIGKLVVSYENDSTVQVKVPKKPPIPYDCRQLGFRDNRAKGWKFLMDVLENPMHTFNFGTAYLYPDGSRKNRIKNRAYDAGWKVCDDLCKKWLRFLSKEYGLQFPKGFKLYEKTQTGPCGERRFKFQIGPPSSESSRLDAGAVHWNKDEEPTRVLYGEFGEDQLRREIILLNRDYSSDSNVHNVDPDNLVLAFQVGRQKFGWTDHFVRELLLE